MKPSSRSRRSCSAASGARGPGSRAARSAAAPRSRPRRGRRASRRCCGTAWSSRSRPARRSRRPGSSARPAVDHRAEYAVAQRQPTVLAERPQARPRRRAARRRPTTRPASRTASRLGRPHPAPARLEEQLVAHRSAVPVVARERRAEQEQQHRQHDRHTMPEPPLRSCVEVERSDAAHEPVTAGAASCPRTRSGRRRAVHAVALGVLGTCGARAACRAAASRCSTICCDRLQSAAETGRVFQAVARRRPRPGRTAASHEQQRRPDASAGG